MAPKRPTRVDSGSMTLSEYFKLSHQERMRMKERFPRRPKSPSPGSKPTGVSKSAKSHFAKAEDHLNAAQKIIDVLREESQRANNETSSESDSNEDGSNEGDSTKDRSSQNGSSQNGYSQNGSSKASSSKASSSKASSSKASSSKASSSKASSSKAASSKVASSRDAAIKAASSQKAYGKAEKERMARKAGEAAPSKAGSRKKRSKVDKSKDAESSEYDSLFDEESPVTLLKENGICLENELPINPQGVENALGKEFPRTKNISPRGLISPGPRCYRNAALQCLFHVPEFYNLLGAVHKDCVRMAEDCITCALQQMMDAYWNGERDTPGLNHYGPLLDNALETIITWDEDYQRHVQSDPYSFMQYLLRFIEWDSYGVDPDIKKLDEANEESPSIGKTFKVEYVTRWTCKECGKEHLPPTAPELGLDVAVWSNLKDGASLEEYIEDPSSELFVDVKQVICDSEICQELQQTPGYVYPDQIRNRTIVHGPEILIVRLRRFTGTPYPAIFSKRGKLLKESYTDSTKITKAIAFKTELDLTEHSEYENDNLIYDLRGVVAHSGPSTDRGHYTAGVCRRSPEDTYSCVDDTKVRVSTRKPTPLVRPPTGTPYILIYSRRSTQPEEDEDGGEEDGSEEDGSEEEESEVDEDEEESEVDEDEEVSEEE